MHLCFDRLCSRFCFNLVFIDNSSLNTRLKAMSVTRFGSMDSSTNREVVMKNYPGKLAVEEFNPVWNTHTKTPDFDARRWTKDTDLENSFNFHCKNTVGWTSITQRHFCRYYILGFALTYASVFLDNYTLNTRLKAINIDRNYDKYTKKLYKKDYS